MNKLETVAIVELQEDEDLRREGTRLFDGEEMLYEGNGALRFLAKPGVFEHRDLQELFDESFPLAELPIVSVEMADAARSLRLHCCFAMWDRVWEDPSRAATLQQYVTNQRQLSSFLFTAFLRTLVPAHLSAHFDQQLAERLFRTCQCSFAPLNAFFGGMAAQEVIKAVTKKYSPLSQLFYLDFLDLVDTGSWLSSAADSGMWFLGSEALQRLAEARVFVVGAGAIGCELLKNLALLGVGSVTVTDDDAIEQSNLNRQFLFRDGDIGKMKSDVACAKAAQLGSGRTRFTAMGYRLQPSTQRIFSNGFFRAHSVVLTALDNITARLYVDSRCVASSVPMIDSGTLGTQGHVQVVLPQLTESYSSQEDPQVSTQIPLCTLKLFPHTMTHCIEWARDLCFEKQLSIKPSVWNRFFFVMPEDSSEPLRLNTAVNWNAIEPTTLSILAKMVSKRHEHLSHFEDCVRLAKAKFDKYFDHDPRRLIAMFPADHTTEDGERFWAPPKRLPTPLYFNADDPQHIDFVWCLSQLLALVWGIAVPAALQQAPQEVARLAASSRVPSFTRSLLASSTASVREALLAKVKGGEDGKSGTPERRKTIGNEWYHETVAEVRRYFSQLAAHPDPGGVAWLSPIEFDKDEPLQLHIGLVAAAANLRARVYGIEGHDIVSIKRIAGRILPAIAATTSCVSGLVCAELLRLMQGGRTVEGHRNSWLNLAVASLALSEPVPPLRQPLGSGLSFTLWDVWESRHSPTFTLAELLDELRLRSGGLDVVGITQGSKIIFAPILYDSRLPLPVAQLVQYDSAIESFVSLKVSFSQNKQHFVGPLLQFHFDV